MITWAIVALICVAIVVIGVSAIIGHCNWGVVTKMKNLWQRIKEWWSYDPWAFDADYAIQHDRVNEGLPPND